jgi:hypothetical protein
MAGCATGPGRMPEALPAWQQRLRDRDRGRPRKSSFIGAPAAFKLEIACQLINRAFGGWGCYHVGSSRERKDWRDVDVRYMLDDKEFAKLFPAAHDNSWEFDARWLLLTVAISDWLTKETGLPIDFQFQPASHANARHSGPRNPVGLNMAPKKGRRRR